MTQLFKGEGVSDLWMNWLGVFENDVTCDIQLFGLCLDKKKKKKKKNLHSSVHHFQVPLILIIFNANINK